MLNTAPPLLEISVYLTDGRRIRFVQNDADAVQWIRDHVNPARLFTQETLIIGNPRSLSAFPTAHVVRVDLKSPVISDSGHAPGLSRVLEITREEFTALNRPEAMPLGQAFVEAELSGGEVVYLAAHFAPAVEVQLLGERTPMDQAAFFTNMFSGQALHAELPDGGMLILNPSRVLRLTFYPAPTILPAGSWRADPLL
jgi:hypothetical protein